MKTFNIILGQEGVMGTHNATNNPEYTPVVAAVTQLRDRFLNDQTFRTPILSLFKSVYEDVSNKLELKTSTTQADDVTVDQQKSNLEIFRETRSSPPSDKNVVDFLTNSLPDLRLDYATFDSDEIGDVTKEEITMNSYFVNLWLKDRAVDLLFLFVAIFLHEVAHSSVVWYGAGLCGNNPKLNSNGIGSEAGDFIENAIFGGISSFEISSKDKRIKKVGLEKDGVFYPISGNRTQATKLMKMDASDGLPLITLTDIMISPAPPSTVTRDFGSLRRSQANNKISLSRLKSGFSTDDDPVTPPPIDSDRSGVFRSRVRNDKIRILPKV